MTRKESIEIIWSNKSINSLSKVESTKIIDRIYDNFESRTCSNCKWCYSYHDGELICTYTESPCGYMNIYKDFGCIEFERKKDE